MERPDVRGMPQFRDRLAGTLDDARLVLAQDRCARTTQFGYAPAVATIDEAVTQISRELSVDRIRPARIRELGQLLVSLNNSRHDLDEHRSRRQSQIDAELESLRHAATVDELYEKAPAALTRCCGIDEAGLWSIQDGAASIVTLHCSDNERRAAAIAAELGPLPGGTHRLEAEVMRRRAGVLVVNAQTDPRVHRETQSRFGAEAHMTVPIMPEGKVIGFFHCGCYPGNRPVDEFDFELVAAFARGFGQVLERVILRARLARQRDYFQRMAAAGADLAGRLAEDEIRLVEGQGDGPDVRVPPPLPPEARIRSLLTRRELDVLELMAAGRTNAEIASELVIGVGTVKFHVKHVLSKLNAVNRAQAVSRYMRIAAAQHNAA